MPLRVGSSNVARIVMPVEPFASVLAEDQFAYADQDLQDASPLWVQLASFSSDDWVIESQTLTNAAAEDSDIYYYNLPVSGRFAVEIEVLSGISTNVDESVGVGGFLDPGTAECLAFWITQTGWSIRIGEAGDAGSVGFHDPSAVVDSGSHAFGTSGTLRMEHEDGVLTFLWDGDPVTTYSGTLPGGDRCFLTFADNHAAVMNSFAIYEYVSERNIIAVYLGAVKVWPDFVDSRAHKTDVQNIPSATWTQITGLAASATHPGTITDGASITAQGDATATITAQVRFNGTAATFRAKGVRVMRNGVEVAFWNNGNSDTLVDFGGTQAGVEIADGDVLVLEAYHENSGDSVRDVQPNETFIQFEEE